MWLTEVYYALSCQGRIRCFLTLYVAESAEQLAIYDIKGERTVDTNEGTRELKQSGAYRSDIAERYRVRSEEIGSRFKEARAQRNASQREQLTG